MHRFSAHYKLVPILFLLIFLTACPIGLIDTGIEGNGTKTPAALSTAYFWGTWIRMDTGSSLLITDTKADSTTISAASSTSITYGSHTLEEQTDNTALLDGTYLLFRKGGANRSFTAKIAGFSDTLSSINRGLGGLEAIGGWQAIRENLSNPSDTEEATSDNEGLLSFTNAVAGSEQVISISNTEVEVQPQFDGEFIGTIPIVESGFSFKVTSEVTDKSDGYLYGQGYNEYTLKIYITNIGDADCETSLYTVTSEDPNLYISGDLSGNFSSIEPGASKELLLTAEYGVMEDEYIDASIRIEITDSSLNPRTWEDYAVLRFHLNPVGLKVQALNIESDSDASLKGFLIHPDGNSQHFTVSNGGTSYLTMPWSSSLYRIAFSGAGADTEMKYTFGAGDAELPSIDDTYSISEINAYEPNDSEEVLSPVSDPDSPVKAYLKKNDIDYYSVDVSGMETVLKSALITYRAIEDGGNEDGIPNPGETIRMDLQLYNTTGREIGSLESSLSSTNSSITVSQNTFTYGNITSGYFHSIDYKDEGDNNGTSYRSDAAPDPSTPGAFVFTIADDCPVGEVIPFTLTMTDSQGNEWTDTFDITVAPPGTEQNPIAITDFNTWIDGYSSGYSDKVYYTFEMSSGGSYQIYWADRYQPEGTSGYTGDVKATGYILDSSILLNDSDSAPFEYTPSETTDFTVYIRAFNYYSGTYGIMIADSP